jgi:hypothetical protein
MSLTLGETVLLIFERCANTCSLDIFLEAVKSDNREDTVLSSRLSEIFAERLAIDVVSRRRVTGDALEPLLSSENLVVTLEFNGDDLNEEDKLSSVFINEERR